MVGTLEARGVAPSMSADFDTSPAFATRPAEAGRKAPIVRGEAKCRRFADLIGQKTSAQRRSNASSKPRETVTPIEANPAALPDRPEAVLSRRLGRFRLLKLVGKSRRSMVWRAAGETAADDAQAALYFLLLPREQPADKEAAAGWHDAVRRGARSVPAPRPYRN